MSRVLTNITLASCVLWTMTFGLAAALPSDPTERLRVLAQCTGRLSAALEHSWLTGATASKDTAVLRSRLEALLPLLRDGTDVDGPTVLHWRVSAKLAHATVLQRAAFSLDSRSARLAKRIVQHHEAECHAIMLS